MPIKKSADDTNKVSNGEEPGITYHHIPMTIELSRRKEEEELMEKYHIVKKKRAVLLGQTEKSDIKDPEPLIIRHMNVFNITEADLLNRWTANKPAHISRSEMLKIVDFYIVFTGPDFEGACKDIKAKILFMTDDLWDDYARQLPFELPY